MKLRLLALSLLVTLPALAQPHLVRPEVFSAIAGEYSGELAQEYTRRIVEHHRIQGSPMMAVVAERVVLAELRQAGIEARLESLASDGKRRYQTYVSPMGWDMRGGELWVEAVGGRKDFVPFRLCRYRDVPMCVSTYSKGGTWTGELVDVGAGTHERDYAQVEVRGKVVLASGYAARVVRQAVIRRGAVGVVIYPAADDRPDHPDMIRYNGLWTHAEELAKTSGGFQISANQYATLRRLMHEGPVRVRGAIDATLGPGQLTLVHAYVRGSERPQEEVLVTAHLDHPKWSANDNASGSAAILEMARALKSLVDSRKLPAPRRTIHFMWVPEFFGTLAYVTEHPEVRRCGAWDDPRPAPQKPAKAPAPCLVANLNLDMVGEDTVKTGSRFYVTRAPDSVPSFLDALLGDVLAETRAARLHAPTGTRHPWPTEMIPYTQGSDHDVFLSMGVPASMFGHDPDWTHHTSEDTVDKTDASEFRRVGVMATAAAYWMAAADEAGWRRLAQLTAAEMSAETARRMGRLALGGGARAGKLLGERMQRLAARMTAAPAEVTGPEQASLAATALPPGSGRGPRRLVILPLDGALFERLEGEDRRWWEAESERFSHDGEGLATGATLELLAYEAINLMDGRRDAADIAALLSAEYLVDFEPAWAERLIGILSSLGVVAKN